MQPADQIPTETGTSTSSSSPSASTGPTGRRTRSSSSCAAGVPVHWTSRITEFPESAGYWSVTTADDVHEVSRDWQTYSSELGGVTLVTEVFPLELARAMFIGMDPPKHDRIKALFQAGFTPKRIAAHEEEIREIVVRCSTGSRGARSATWSPTSPSPRSPG